MTRGFLEIDDKYRRLEDSRFVVLPISYEETASYLKGTAKAPEAIIDASEQIEVFDEQLLGEFYECGIYTSELLDGKGVGPEEMQRVVYAKAKEFVDSGKFVLGLGGEHSISSALVKAAAEKYDDLWVVQIDAHADMRDEYHGSKFNHACVMRRIFDMGIGFVGVGVRSFDKDQYEFMVENKIRIFGPEEISKDAGWVEKCLDCVGRNIYLTVDIDGFDPGAAPGTGTPEPGGLGYWQVVELILEIGRKKNLVGADIVEVIPGLAGAVTEVLAARVGYKIIAAAQLGK